MNLEVYPTTITTWHRVLTHNVPSASLDMTKRQEYKPSKARKLEKTGTQRAYEYVQPKGQVHWPTFLAWSKEQGLSYTAITNMFRLLCDSGEAIKICHAGSNKIRSIEITTTKTYLERFGAKVECDLDPALDHKPLLIFIKTFLGKKKIGERFKSSELSHDKTRRQRLVTKMSNDGYVKKYPQGRMLFLAKVKEVV